MDGVVRVQIFLVTGARSCSLFNLFFAVFLRSFHPQRLIAIFMKFRAMCEKKVHRIIFSVALSLLCSLVIAQKTDSLPVVDYSSPKEFEIGGINVTGAKYSDFNAVISISGLKVGSTIRIPGPEIPKALKSLWNLRLFTDVRIIQEKTIGDVVFLEIQVLERPRLSNYTYKGVRKSRHTDLNDAIKEYLAKGGIVTENLKAGAAGIIQKYFVKKGYLDAKVAVSEEPDTSRVNAVLLVFDIDQGPRIKISNIDVVNNTAVKDKKLLGKLKKTKEKSRIFASSKFR